MNTLYLMRHSLTEANEKRLYGGSTDSPLTEKGVAVAEGRRGVNAISTSPAACGGPMKRSFT